MTVHRLRPLPVGRSRGALLVPHAVASTTQAALQDFSGDDGRHEGLVYWAGRRVGDDICVLAAVVPRCMHERFRVIAKADAIGDVARRCRVDRLAVVAQVHSHPGTDTRHSDGDDDLVLMPFEGMFSLVVAEYGDGELLPECGAGLHQFQNGRWVWIDPEAGYGLRVIGERLMATP